MNSENNTQATPNLAEKNTVETNRSLTPQFNKAANPDLLTRATNATLLMLVGVVLSQVSSAVLNHLSNPQSLTSKAPQPQLVSDIAIQDPQGKTVTTLRNDFSQYKAEEDARQKRLMEYMAQSDVGRELLQASGDNINLRHTLQENEKLGSDAFAQGNGYSLRPGIASDAKIIMLIAHEQYHNYQKTHGFDLQGKTLNPVQEIIYSWMQESGANAAANVVAHELSLNKDLPKELRDDLKKHVIAKIPDIAQNYDHASRTEVAHMSIRGYFKYSVNGNRLSYASNFFDSNASNRVSLVLSRLGTLAENMPLEKKQTFLKSFANTSIDFDALQNQMTIPDGEGGRIKIVPEGFRIGTQKDTPLDDTAVFFLANLHHKLTSVPASTTPDGTVMFQGDLAIPTHWQTAGLKEDYLQRYPDETHFFENQKQVSPTRKILQSIRF
ncbi:MAG: hypothetical protein ACOYK8_08935 [Alphaproteobacteria bacterium]